MKIYIEINFLHRYVFCLRNYDVIEMIFDSFAIHVILVGEREREIGVLIKLIIFNFIILDKEECHTKDKYTRRRRYQAIKFQLIKMNSFMLLSHLLL